MATPVCVMCCSSVVNLDNPNTCQGLKHGTADTVNVRTLVHLVVMVIGIISWICLRSVFELPDKVAVIPPSATVETLSEDVEKDSQNVDSDDTISFADVDTL
jgi:hypothetical protein